MREQRSRKARKLEGFSESGTSAALYENVYAPLFPISFYAMVAQRYMHEYGATPEDFAEVAPGVFARDVPVERDESPTLGERLEKWARTVQITEEKPDGSVRGYLRVTSCASWGQFLAMVAQEKLSHFLGSSKLTINEKEILCLKLSSLPWGCLLYR